MPELTLSLSADRTTGRLTLPGGGALTLSTGDVETLIVQLSRLRTDMAPARPRTDPTPDSMVLSAPDMRWFLGKETIPGQVFLALQHPGVGWVAIVLDEPRAQEMTQRMADMLAGPHPKA